MTKLRDQFELWFAGNTEEGDDALWAAFQAGAKYKEDREVLLIESFRRDYETPWREQVIKQIREEFQ